MALNVKGSDSLYWKTGIDTSGLALGSNKAKGILLGLTSNISKMDVFAGLSVSAIMAFAKISNEAYNFSKKFETAMREVQTISDAVKNDFTGISQEIINMSKIVPDRADQLAKAYYQIVSAGYDGAEALDMLAVSAKLAVAGVTDTFVAADAMTSIMNAYGAAAGNALNISDKLFKVVKLGKTTMEELGPAITTVTGLAAQAGMSFDDLMAIIAKGVKTLGTTEMVTGVRGMLIALVKQQDETIKKAKQLGIEFDISALKTKGFSGFLKELMDNTGGNIKLLAQLFPRVQGLSGLLAVATEAGGDFDEVLKEITNSAGSTEEAFRIMIETTDNQLAILRNNVLAKMKPLGDDILAQVNKIAKVINENLTSAVKDVTKASEKERFEFENNIAVLEQLWQKTNKTAGEKKVLSEAIETLQKKYPEYLSNIDTEKTSYDELTKAIELTREALEDKIILEMKLAEQSDLIRKQVNIRLKEQELIKAIAIEQKRVNERLKETGLTYEGLVESTLDQQIAYGNIVGKLGVMKGQLETNLENQKGIKDELKVIDDIYGDLIRKQDAIKTGSGEQVETIKEIGKAIENAFSGLKLDIPEFGKFDFDFSGGTASLSELMSVFGEHTEQLEAFRQAGIDTTALLDEEWRDFTENIKEYYGEDSTTYIAAMNLKKDADNEYFEWKREKWIEEHEVAVNALGVLEAGYDTFINSILDKEMTGKERREAIWHSMKSSFINLLGDMLKKYVADVIMRAVISKASQAADITAAVITGTAIAAAYAPAAAMASLASFGANSIPAMAGITSTTALAQLLSIIKLNKGGEVDYKNDGGEINVGSHLNKDSVLSLLTRKEIVIQRDSAQYKDNRNIALGMNKDKDFIYKNFIPRNSGGSVDTSSNFRTPSFPSFPSFPTSMNVSSNQLERLITAVQAQTLTQAINSDSKIDNVPDESRMDMEQFVIKFNETQERMTDRGYEE